MLLNNRILGPLLLAVGLASWGCGEGGEPAGSCSVNTDCATGMYCSTGGLCTADCRSNSDCPNNQKCNSFGKCVPASNIDSGVRKDGASPSPDVARPDSKTPLDKKWPDKQWKPDLSIPDAPQTKPDKSQGTDTSIPDSYLPKPDVGQVLLSVTNISFPSLFPVKKFPTCFSHLLGSTSLSPAYPFGKVTLKNAGTLPATGVSVEMQLSNYSTAAKKTMSVPAGTSVTVDITPGFNFTKLFSLTSDVPDNVITTVKHNGNTIKSDTQQISVASRNAFYTPMWNPWSAVFVTPTDKQGAVKQLVSDVSKNMPGKAWGGYQNMNAKPWSQSISVNSYSTDSTYLLKGHQICVSITGISTIGLDNDIDLYVLDYANYQIFAAGKSATTVAMKKDAKAGSQLCFVAAADGWYYMVFYNTPDNYFGRTVTRSRNASHFDVTYYHGEALFNTLKAKGLTYVNAPGGNFWNSVQNVYYPSESLKSNGANCIDGTLLFASVFEVAGMRPVLIYVPGHAFVGVRMWGNEDTIIPIETTMVGTNTFNNAWISAEQSYSKYNAQGKLVLIDVKKARKIGFSAAPM